MGGGLRNHDLSSLLDQARSLVSRFLKTAMRRVATVRLQRGQSVAASSMYAIAS